MLEGLVANLLNRFLGAYIDNFDPKQLNVGIWSGDVKLKNLKLRREALDKFRLPIDVQEGYLGELTLSIPWSNLAKKPVKVHINDVFLLAAPKVDQEYDEEDEKRRAQALKQEKLDSAELLNRRSPEISSDDSKKSQSFADSMSTKIIDNLQIMIEGVHIRYEDDFSSTGNPFSVGLTLSELSATSVDSNWQPTFVQTSEQSSFKLAKLESLAIYWNTNTVSLAGKSTEDFIKTFGELIARDQEVSNHQFILRPVNALGKIKLNKTSTSTEPKIDIALLFDEIAVAIDQDQYRDALKMIDTFHFFIRHQEYRKYRPRVTVKDDPRAWLQFAFTSVLRGVHSKNVVWTWENMKNRRDERRRYIELYKAKQAEKISLDQSAELKRLEEDLSYSDIRRYRSLAKAQLKKENALKPKQVAKQAQGWIAWAWSGNHAAADDAKAQGDTVMTVEQRKELYDAIEWNEDQALVDGLDAPEDSVLLNISARLRQGSLTLKKSKAQHNEDILQLLFETFGAHFKKRPKSMFADMALKTMRITDGTTPGTLYKNIVKVKENDTTENITRNMSPMKNFASEDQPIEDPLFYASFEDQPLSGIAQTEIVARLKALEIVYNAYCIETLLQFVKPPKSQMESITALLEVAGEAAKDFRESGRASLEFALTEHKTLAAHLDLQAPLIIVPESCTDKDAACIILDAGKIHIESDLVQQDKINEIQAKGHQQLTDDEMRELQALCYDKFNLRLESTQILISPSVAQGLAALRSAEDRRYHVVDRINMDFLLEISILPKNASLTLTKFRISGHLPNLSARVSDVKYKTMMRIIDVAIPKDSDEEVSQSNSDRDNLNHTIIALPGRRERTFSSSYQEDSTIAGLTYSDHDDAVGDEDDDAENDKFVAAPMDLDEKDLLYRQKIFEFRFTVGELRGSLFKADAQASDDGQLLVDIVLQQFALDFVLRQYDMQADVILKSFIIEDRMNTDSPPEFQRLVTSEQIGEDDQEQRDLVHVKYVQVKPDSPEFQSIYGGVEKNVDVALSTINLIVTQKSILTLFDFILTTFTGTEVTNAVADLQQTSIAVTNSPNPQMSTSDESKMRVKVELTSIVLVLNQDGIRLATLKMSKGDVGVFLNGPTLRVSAKLGNLSVRDDVNQGSDAFSAFRQIISIQGDELVDFQYETFDKSTVATYPGYDSSVYLRLNSVKINCVEEPLRKIMNFGSKFARMKAIFDNARIAAISQVQQAQEQAGKMHFDILIRTPILIFPRLSTETADRDLIVANLGELFAKNTFELTSDAEDGNYVNKVKVGVRNISLSSQFQYVGSIREELQMIDDADATFDIDIVEHQPGSNVPAIRIAGHVSDIKLQVTQGQYKFLMDLSQSLPMIFTGDELDEEERELEQTLSQQPKPDPEHIEETSKNQERDASSFVHVDEEQDIYTSLEADLSIGDLILELYTNNEDFAVGDLDKASLTRFSLNKTKAKFATQSDNSVQGELNIQSFTVEDTRVIKNNKFREVIPAIKHDGHQFNASITISGQQDRALMAMLTIDTPRMIFSLEYLFELQHWAMSAFKEETIDDIGSDEGLTASGIVPRKIPDVDDIVDKRTLESATARPRRPSTTTAAVSKAASPDQQTMSIAYRVNIVDPSIILVANSSKHDTDAIVLTAKQLLLTQQSVLMLNVDKVGMYMTKMNEFETRRLRILDDFSLSLSLDARVEAGRRSIQIIEVDVDPLVLRLSLRDIMLVMQIASTASNLSSDVPQSEPEIKAVESKRRRSSTAAGLSQRRKSIGTASRMNRSTNARQSMATKIKEESTPDNASLPDTGITSAIVNKEELRATFEGLRLVLIGSLHELPIIDVSIYKFTVNIKNWTSDMFIDTSIRAFANIYNFSVSHWEPLIEPFDIGFHVAKTLNPEKLDVNIFSRKRIEMTLTSNTIALASKSFDYLSSNPDDILTRVRGNDAPYRILNMTGFPLTLWSDTQNDDTDQSSGAKKIEDGEEISWSFYDWRTQRENLSNNEKNSRLAIKIEDSDWETVRDIPVNTEGEKIYVLKQKEKTGSINHRVVVHIHLRADYVKYITFRSALLFENRTKIPLELVAVDEKGNKRSKIYKIAPEEDCAAPIRAALDCGFKIRPDPGFHYQWSHQTLTWHELYESPALSVNCKPVDGEGSNWNFQCFSRFDANGTLAGRYPYQTIKISPPIEINNLLPYDLEYRVFDDKTKQDHKNYLRKGLLGPVHTVDLKHVLLLSVKLVDSHPKYKTSQFAVIHTNDPDSFRQEGRVVVVDEQGLKTNLGLHYTKLPDSGGAFVVSIYAPYLVLNKTGLDIQIKSKTFLQKARAGAGHLPSGNGIVAAPYIHSYASDERKNRSLLKIGDSNWSTPQSFEAIGSVSDITIPDSDNKEIHIGIQIEEGQGKYKLTKVVSLTPRFILKSTLSVDINIREPRSSDILTLKSGKTLPLHFMRAGQERQLVMAFPGMDNHWSNPINIQNVGRTHLKIQKQGEHQQLIKIDIMLEGPALFLNVSEESRWPFEIRNESKTDFIYYQGNPYPDEDSGIRYYPERYRIPAKCSMPYAWDFPAAAQHSLVLCPWTEKTSRPRHLRLDEIGSFEPFRVPSNPNKPGAESRAVDLNVVADGPQRKLIIRDYDPKTSLYKLKRNSTTRQRLLRADSSASIASNNEFETVASTKDTRPTLTAVVRLEGFGLSLINSRHQELAYVSLRNIELNYSDSPAEVHYDLLCKWIQIDNQLYGGIYPILLYPTVVPKTGREMDIRPAWRAALTQAKDDSHGVFFVKYATVLLQEMTMEVDEDFLFALLDFSKVPGASWSEIHEGVLCDDKIEIPEPSGAISSSDVYFEVLHLQPAQLNLSFVRTERVNVEDKTSSRNPLMFFFNILTMAIGNINDAPVRLNALLMENVLTSFPLLQASIHTHYGQEFFYQVHKILGSADFLGNPVGLFTNITSGVADIFYEPYNGFVMSDRPQELGIGIAKGTASFVKKTVFGVSDSISKVTGSVSKGLSVATMDKQFQDRRRMTRARNKPKHALYGVQQGGMALISSLGSGVEGLARQPFEGAEREGAAGFFKGVGKGLLGLATKPVIGVFDLASNVSEGIRNTTTVFDEDGLSKVRITRHVGRDGIVRPFNQNEALGLFWLRQLNNSKLSKEDYLAHYNITDEATLLITYQTMILAKTKNFTVEWDIPFTDLKTIALEKTGIQLILKGVRGPFIPIEEESGRKFVYSKIKIAVTEYNNSG